MQVGGMMAHVFRIFIGDLDVMLVCLTWMVFSTLLLIALKLIDRGGES